ncbi:MAG: DUF2188 domain-containing protein [Chitinophagaceae bacterium]|nr:DUF2188 domain-containing protein [Chitinophagaceae bacterium]
MDRLQYFVVLHDNQWKISFQGKHYGPYNTQKKRFKAVDAAHTEGRKGNNSQVLIQGQNNQWRTEWTYGNDPYPPKG